MTDQPSYQAQHGQLSAPQPIHLGHRASNMLVPNQVLALTRQRDEARVRLADFRLTLWELSDMTQQRNQARLLLAEATLLNGELVDRLDQMTRQASGRLAADQQHAGEPEHLARARDVSAEPDVCPFCDTSDDPPTTTGHVMPARALLHQKHAVGLLW
jgi:hypothetical protein